VSDTFDIALIDTPPRLTAGTINALCSSTHLLIPTVFDKLSAEAVGTFVKGVHVLQTHLNPMIELLGVGTLTYQQAELRTGSSKPKILLSPKYNIPGEPTPSSSTVIHARRLLQPRPVRVSPILPLTP
jgi:AAA domain